MLTCDKMTKNLGLVVADSRLPSKLPPFTTVHDARDLEAWAPGD